MGYIKKPNSMSEQPETVPQDAPVENAEGDAGNHEGQGENVDQSSKKAHQDDAEGENDAMNSQPEGEGDGEAAPKKKKKRRYVKKAVQRRSFDLTGIHHLPATHYNALTDQLAELLRRP